MANDTDNTTTAPALTAAAGYAGEERDISITVYIYEHGDELDLEIDDKGLEASFISPCELVKKHYVLGTDAMAGDAECVTRFVQALKASGVSVARYEFLSHTK